MKKGFTLIELLGVIVILGLIVTVAVPSLIESNKQAQSNEEKDFINTLELAAKDYINYYSDPDVCDEDDTNCKTVASDLGEIYIDPTKTKTIETKTLKTVGFLKKSLVDPFTNNTLESENIKILIANKEGKLKATKITIYDNEGNKLGEKQNE